MISSTTATTSSTKPNVIDSHLHVWGTLDDSVSQRYPYVQDPPSTLQNCATVSSLLQHMENADIDGALIVQPINYLYDHSYVLNAIQQYPSKLKGMLLYNPTERDEHMAIQRLEELVLAGFVGVRFNPYLFPKPPHSDHESDTATSKPQWGLMSEGAGLKIYQRCASLHIPVGIMCFQGLHLHYNDILQLLEASPQTIMILDHFAFTKLNDDGGENIEDSISPEQKTFEQLLELSKYPSVHVKISALFRMNDSQNSSGSSNQYQRIYHERFIPLLQAYGSQRLLYGSDFPYILESTSPGEIDNAVYTNACQLVASWCPDIASRNAIMGGNAERLFGPWGTPSSTTTP
jgi:predicted TIM-barrel fold metal-dependent hydrolase